MASEQERREVLDAKAKQGETVIPGGTGGKSLEAQEHLAEGNLFVSLVHVWQLFQGLRTLIGLIQYNFFFFFVLIGMKYCWW